MRTHSSTPDSSHGFPGGYVDGRMVDSLSDDDEVGGWVLFLMILMGKKGVEQASMRLGCKFTQI